MSAHVGGNLLYTYIPLPCASLGQGFATLRGFAPLTGLSPCLEDFFEKTEQVDKETLLPPQGGRVKETGGLRFPT